MSDRMKAVGVGIRGRPAQARDPRFRQLVALAEAGGFTMVKEGGAIRKNEKAKFITWA